MPRFAANLGYLFTDRPLIERIGAAAACGFKAVELQFPYYLPPAAVRAEIGKHALTLLGLNSPRGERGVNSASPRCPAASGTGTRAVRQGARLRRGDRRQRRPLSRRHGRAG